jgi:hypothetical protein
MWNYRVFKKTDEEYGIIECYYDKNGKPEMRSDFITPFGEDVKELQADLKHMVSALKKPVLTEQDFKRETHSCWGCREQTANKNSICDKCVRDPKTNVCLRCKGNPVETNMAYVCSECVFKQLDETLVDSESN